MSRSQSHQRKVWREYMLRHRQAWKLAIQDLVVFGSGVVFMDSEGNQRYLAPSEYYKADFIDSTEQPKI